MINLSLDCVIKLEEPIDALEKRRASFGFLKHMRPIRTSAATWMRETEESNDLQVIAVGKSGYGKSTTLNTLIGKNVFQTDDNVGCTRRMQSAEFKFPITDGTSYFSLADLPGLGENPQRDAEYRDLYKNAFNKAHAIVYFLRADHRDYSVDLRLFDELFCYADHKAKLIIAMNAIDKSPPLCRSTPFVLSAEQQANIKTKIADVSKLFSLSTDDVVPLSGLEDYNTDLLVHKLYEKLSPYIEFNGKSFISKFRFESHMFGTYGPEGPGQWWLP